MANRIIAWQYTSDNGTLFSTGIEDEVAAQVNGSSVVLIGGSALAANHTKPPLPRQMKPRRAVVQDATGYTREVVLMTPTAPLATLGTSIDLEDSDGASHTCVSVALKAESFRKRRQQAA